MSVVIPDALATSDDYATWTGTTAPANIDQILRSCTTLVLNATKAARYLVDTSGVATDATILAAMRDATCIQAAAWVALAIDPLTGGAATSAVKKMKRIATAHIEYADSGVAATARMNAYTGLVPDAARKLRLAGVLGFAVRAVR